MSCILLGDYHSLSALSIPLFLERISAGFPSPAEDYIEKTLDLNELCIEHPTATFFVRVQGESMIEAGIFPDDVLVVDRSLLAGHPAARGRAGHIQKDIEHEERGQHA